MRSKTTSIEVAPSPRAFRRRVIGSVCAVVLLTSSSAFAQDARPDADKRLNDERRAEADRLFDLGRKLFDEGRFPEACDKFAASRNVVPKTGALINLAVCTERLGQVATPWALYREAMISAQRTQRTATDEEAKKRAAEAYDFAKKRVAALEPQVIFAVVPGVPQPPPNTVLSLDHHIVGQFPLIAPLPIPVEKGPHIARFEAPGYKPIIVEFFAQSPAAGETTTEVEIVIPKEYEKEPAASTTPAVAPVLAAPAQAPHESVAPVAPKPAGVSGQQKAALAIGGVGVLAVTVGATFGILAIGQAGVAKDKCPGADGTACGSDAGLEAERNARTYGHVAEIGLGVGVVGIAVGTVLWLTDKSGKKSNGELHVGSIRATPTVSLGGLGVAGRF